MYHYFDTDVAKKYDMRTAILLRFFSDEVENNKKAKIFSEKGRHWVVYALDDLMEIFPYMKRTSLKKSIKTLRDEGLLLVEHFYESEFDRTNWYSLTEEGEKLAKGGDGDGK